MHVTMSQHTVYTTNTTEMACIPFLLLQVPRKWLAACSGLIPTHPAHALNMATMHLAMAVLATSADKSSSCSRQMAAQLWEQVQQSDILQQLPGLLSSTVTTLQTQLTGEPEPLCSGEKKVTQDILTGVLSMMHAVVQVQPAYYSTHTAQQQCLAPVMQLALMTLQNVSKSLAHDGQQKWMEHLLYTAGEVGVAAAAAAAAGVEDFALVVESTSQTELEGVTDADTCSASSSSCGASNTARASTSYVAAPGVAATSSAGGAARRADAMTATVGVLRVEQSVQWSCLAGLIPMLVQHVQHMHLTNGEPATGSSAEQPLPARRQHGNKRRENQEGPATLEGGSGMPLSGCLLCWLLVCQQRMATCWSTWGAAGRWGYGLHNCSSSSKTVTSVGCSGCTVGALQC